LRTRRSLGDIRIRTGTEDLEPRKIIKNREKIAERVANAAAKFDETSSGKKAGKKGYFWRKDNQVATPEGFRQLKKVVESAEHKSNASGQAADQGSYRQLSFLKSNIFARSFR
jgi:hypothetical protein